MSESGKVLKSEAAVKLAVKLHEGMTDKYGNPYFEHLERVANRVRDMEFECVNETSLIDDYITAAYLHDTVEDTEASLEDIEFDFGLTIAESVNLLTRKKDESYSDYVGNIKRAAATTVAGKIARVVKLADLLDHLMGPTPCPPTLIKRYEKSLYVLYGTV